MKKSRLTQEQIAFALRRAEGGTRVVRHIGRWVFRRQHFSTGRSNIVDLAWGITSIKAARREETAT